MNIEMKDVESSLVAMEALGNTEATLSERVSVFTSPETFGTILTNIEEAVANESKILI